MSVKTVYPPQSDPASGGKASGEAIFTVQIAAAAQVATTATVFSTSAA